MDLGDSIGDLGPGARLVELSVRDEPGAWAAAGFTVQDGRVEIGDTTVVLVGGSDEARSIDGWSLAGLDPPPPSSGDSRPSPSPGPDEQPTTDGQPTATGPTLDGLATAYVAAPRPRSAAPPPHPNGVIGLDHVVVSTPDLERTIAALAVVGLACRRIRETDASGSPMRQAFFRLGSTILEVISGGAGSGESADDAPARWFGLALDVVDLDETAELLGAGLGRPKRAVQEGRRIATVRHRSFDVSVSLAVMDHHADR